MLSKIGAFFKLPLAQEQAKNEMEEAERTLLKHEMAAIYHRKMSECYQETIEHLRSCNPSRATSL